MNKIRLLFLSFLLITIAACTTAKDPADEKETLSTHVVTDLLDDGLFAHVPLDRVVGYKTRHKYTITCNGISYGAADYERRPYGYKIELLSGQFLRVNHDCSVRPANVKKSIYLYDNVL